jgi:hypothetical protein
MDPNVCWNTINTLFGDNKPDEAAIYVWALQGWLSKGGFKPVNFDAKLFKTMVSWTQGKRYSV